MKEILNLETVSDYGRRVGHASQHPLVSVIDLNGVTYQPGARAKALRFNFYAVFLKQGEHCTIRYGRENYDFQEGTLVFIGPNQVIDVSWNPDDYQPTGHVLLFHPDILFGTHLATKMKTYSFFSYEINEGLHLSDRERQIVFDCFDKIKFELSQNVDTHSKSLIISNIELFLNYCNRFYDRQFITRDKANHGLLQSFEAALNDYLHSGKAREFGIPSVSYFAQRLHLSSNYFGDLIKKEVGINAQEYIQNKMIEVAKVKIFDYDTSVSQIAYDLGFKYPQHFTRLFKKKVGYSPSEYRMMN